MDTYEPTPTADLIERRRAARGISVRKASEKAKLSEGRWRQIAKGYQQAAAGVRVPVNAPAETLARMAHAVGVTAVEVEVLGDEEVAALLADQQRRVARHPSRLFSDLPPAVAELSDDELLAELGRRLSRRRALTEEGQVHDDSTATTHAGGSPAEVDEFRRLRNVPELTSIGAGLDDVSEVDYTLAARDRDDDAESEAQQIDP